MFQDLGDYKGIKIFYFLMVEEGRLRVKEKIGVFYYSFRRLRVRDYLFNFFFVYFYFSLFEDNVN